VACFFGDGAANRGPFLEGLNWAQVYQLPVLFVCEDNRISATTPTGPMTAGAGVSARARAGHAGPAVDGNDVAGGGCRGGPPDRRDPRRRQGPRLMHA
jgi:TPP-dependent pyruvate/acetoin dehydrogenase alpha subunit